MTKHPKGYHRAKENEKFRHTNFEMETSTHFPLLIKAVQMTEGPVLEIGSGLFSTPLLHWLCFGTGRRLETWEAYPHYLEFAKKFQTPDHYVLHIDRVQDVDLDTLYPRRFSVVFIDHSPKRPRTRGDDAILFKDRADYVILHDAGEEPMVKYGYEKAYPHFKYRYDWEGAWPHTTVLSNFHDLSDFHA